MTAVAPAASASIVFLINSLEGGGAERIVALLLREFEGQLNRDYNFTVELVLLDDLPFAYEIPPAVRVHIFDSRGGLVRSLRSLQKWLREHRPALVVSHLTRANIAATVSCRVLGIPCLLMEHVNTSSHFSGKSFHAWMSRQLVRWVYPRANKVIAVSEGVAHELAAHYAVREDRLVVIPTAFDVDRICALAADDVEQTLPEDFIVGVGRLTANKNFALLLDAYAAAEIEPHLVILGQGEEREALQRRIAELGLDERVHLPGFIDNPYAIMRRARAFVSSSNAEGFPVAAGEALVLGRPVLMTDCPSGPAELLGGSAQAGAGVVWGDYGLLTPVGDREAFTEGLRAVISPAMAEIGERGRARMEACRPAAIAQRHAQTIQDVLMAQRSSAVAHA